MSHKALIGIIAILSAVNLSAEESIVGIWANEHKAVEFKKKGGIEFENGDGVLRGDYAVKDGKLTFSVEPLKGISASSTIEYKVNGDVLTLGKDVILKRDSLRTERKKVRPFLKEILSAMIQYQGGGYESDETLHGFYPRNHLLLDGSIAVPGKPDLKLSLIPDGYYEIIKTSGYDVKIINSERGKLASDDSFVVCLIGEKATFMTSMLENGEKRAETKEDIRNKSYVDVVKYFK